MNITHNRIEYTDEEWNIIKTLDEKVQLSIKRGLITLQDVIKSTTERA